MSISRQNLSIVIVTFKSEEVIHECIKSIDKDIKITVVENSNNNQFKDELEKTYINVSCMLSSGNLGMGTANNIGIKCATTDYVLILNPDVILETSTINELIIASKKNSSFAILAPISNDIDYPNYKLDKSEINKIENKSPFKVKSVDGFAMLFNKKKLDTIFSKNYFDENFFLYLENDDLCKRVNDNKEDIYIVPSSKINHLGGKAVNQLYEFEIELSRNWHWIWSKFYFNKKHYGFIFALISGLPSFVSSIIKIFFYYILNDYKKKKIYSNRAYGFLSALFGRKSFYRPKINN